MKKIKKEMEYTDNLINQLGFSLTEKFLYTSQEMEEKIKKCYENATYFKNTKYSSYLALGKETKLEDNIIKKNKHLCFGEIGKKLEKFGIRIKIVERKWIKGKNEYMYGLVFINNVNEFVNGLKDGYFKSEIWKDLF